MNIELHIMSYVIKFITIIFILLALGTLEKKKNLVKKYFRGIHNSLLLSYTSQGKIGKFFTIVAGIGFIMFLFLMAFQICCIADGKSITGKNIVVMMCAWLLSLFIVYVLFGSVMLIFTKTIGVIAEVKNNKIAVRMIISFLLLLMLMLFTLADESVMKNNLSYLFVGSVTCYILNIDILLKIVQNPFCVVEDKKHYKGENRVLIITCSVLIVLMIIFSLYLLVLWTFYTHENAYICTTKEQVTKWILLYYTVISFTTIGYGDVIPCVSESRAVAIVIAITSVICLVIFVNSVLSEKKEIFINYQNEEKDSVNANEKQ